MAGYAADLHDHILSEKKSGVVTGLAWTQAGGEILFIEALFTQGSGKLLLTGKLGDVMKESAYLAMSLVKAKIPEGMGKIREMRSAHPCAGRRCA